MKFNSLLILILLLTLPSCKGQTPSVSFNINAAKGDKVKALSDNIMVVYQDRKNNYWLGSWEDGLYKYDSKNILHYTTKHGLPGNRVEEIKEDNAGNIYINTNKGVSKYDGQRFTTLNLIKTGGEWKLEANDLWFKQGWDSGFVARYDGQHLYRLKLLKTEKGKAFFAANPRAADPYIVYSIYKDSRGYIWFGTAALGAFRYNGKSFDWITEEDVTELHNGPSNGVRSIIEDKDGYFWFNSNYRYKVYGNTDEQVFYKREKSIGSFDGKNDGNTGEYLSIAKANDNTLWIATYTDGIWRVEGNKISHYAVTENGQQINIFSIYKDNDGGLWLGTHKNGVYKFNGKTFERFLP